MFITTLKKRTALLKKRGKGESQGPTQSMGTGSLSQDSALTASTVGKGLKSPTGRRRRYAAGLG